MKGLRLFFAACLAPLAFQPAVADDASDIARAGTRRTTTQNTSTVRQRQKSDNQNTTNSATISRTTKSATTAVRERDKTAPRTNAVQSDTSRATISQKTENKTVSARATTATVQSRNLEQKNRVVTRDTAPKQKNISRSAVSTRGGNMTGTNTGRSAKTPTRAITRSATMARAATRDDILTRNFSKCRDVFHSCMDEFCANKDSQLRRCACSSRANEFEKTKQKLAQAEDKLLSFSERLITVNMNEEDVIAMNQATEGELAYAADDKSESKKLLDQIAKKLNTSFDNSNFDNSLNAINLSLNTDSAFDNVDSLLGATTTTKSGTDLYVSALPVCREMAAEVCTPDELNIAESGYQMSIEQDCNTVAKSYQSQTEQARAKVFESGALLDMSRLDIHQQRNSDDILTCKKKMLDMLSDASVCGDGLGKCLDTSGRYIDPTTGTAFLTNDLSDLGKLITRPTGTQTWTNAPGNDKFISFLDSKKTFLEPAMEKCQDIADNVWNSFIEDALAQIKLAQDKKLEEVRQSCTTLTAECLTAAKDTIQEFDARALSIFGIEADKTVNAMCESVKTACNTLLKDTGGAADWIGGMSQIATETTFDTIMHTCREVGRNCIIQVCKSTSGNFGLCEDIYTSINRKSIINRSACWDEVLQCVASAGTDALKNIQQTTIDNGYFQNGNFYKNMYTGPEPNYDICKQKCEDDTNNNECYTCRLAERIWGNCEYEPTNTNFTNKIMIAYKENTPGTEDVDRTLLSWFAYNTGTSNLDNNCTDFTCKPGFVYNSEYKQCVPSDNITTTGNVCIKDLQYKTSQYKQDETTQDDTTQYTTACCVSGKRDYFDNCCDNNSVALTISVTPMYQSKTPTDDALKGFDTSPTTICVPKDTQNVTYFAKYYTTGSATSKDNHMAYHVYCLDGVVEQITTTRTYTNGELEYVGITCPNDKFLFIDSTGVYYKITKANDNQYSEGTFSNNWYTGTLQSLATANIGTNDMGQPYTCDLNIIVNDAGNEITTRAWYSGTSTTNQCKWKNQDVDPLHYLIKY